jgi:hypothetical protein
MQVLEGLSKKRRALGRWGRVRRGWFVRFVSGKCGHCDLRRLVEAPEAVYGSRANVDMFVWTCVDIEAVTHLTRFCPVHQTGECLTRILSSSNRRLHRRKHVRTDTQVSPVPHKPTSNS